MPGERRHIIVIGGAGLSLEPDALTIERYILRQTQQTEPLVCYLPTASGDADASIVRFYEACSRLRCRPSHLTFFRRTPADLRSLLLQQNVIYVGGGNTRSMLAVWGDWGVPDILREAWEAGIVLAGVSAGAICWFEQGVTDSVAGQLLPLAGLGFLPGSCCPHYDSEAERRPTYHRLLLGGKISPGIAVEDGVGVHFIGTEIYRAVSAREKACAYQVRVRAGVVEEEVLPITRDRLQEEDAMVRSR